MRTQRRGSRAETDSRHQLESLERLVSELSAKNRKIPVLVEGEKDERALRALGLEGAIVRVKGNDPVFHVCERVAKRHHEAIVLVDWDAGGGKLSRMLREMLRSNGVAADFEFRRAIAHETRREIHQVESLPAYLARLRERAR